MLENGAVKKRLFILISSILLVSVLGCDFSRIVRKYEWNYQIVKDEEGNYDESNFNYDYEYKYYLDTVENREAPLTENQLNKKRTDLIKKRAQEIHEMFVMRKNKWWNYYERGLEFLANGCLEVNINETGSAIGAIPDFKKATELLNDDQLSAKTYGVRTVDYFGNRDLGVAYYFNKDYRFFELNKDCLVKLEDADIPQPLITFLKILKEVNIKKRTKSEFFEALESKFGKPFTNLSKGQKNMLLNICEEGALKRFLFSLDKVKSGETKHFLRNVLKKMRKNLDLNKKSNSTINIVSHNNGSIENEPTIKMRGIINEPEYFVDTISVCYGKNCSEDNYDLVGSDVGLKEYKFSYDIDLNEGENIINIKVANYAGIENEKRIKIYRKRENRGNKILMKKRTENLDKNNKFPILFASNDNNFSKKISFKTLIAEVNDKKTTELNLIKSKKEIVKKLKNVLRINKLHYALTILPFAFTGTFIDEVKGYENDMKMAIDDALYYELREAFYNEDRFAFKEYFKNQEKHFEGYEYYSYMETVIGLESDELSLIQDVRNKAFKKFKKGIDIDSVVIGAINYNNNLKMMKIKIYIHEMDDGGGELFEDEELSFVEEDIVIVNKTLLEGLANRIKKDLVERFPYQYGFVKEKREEEKDIVISLNKYDKIFHKMKLFVIKDTKRYDIKLESKISNIFDGESIAVIIDNKYNKFSFVKENQIVFSK